MQATHQLVVVVVVVLNCWQYVYFINVMNIHLYRWAVVIDETFYINDENLYHNIEVYNGRHSESLNERIMLNKLIRIKPHKGKTWEDISLSLIYSSMSSAFKHKTNSSNKQGRSHSRPCVIHHPAKHVGWSSCRGKKTRRGRHGHNACQLTV